MDRVMCSVEAVKARIAAGEAMLLAADERVLGGLPRGNWIAGTIPYFMGEEGGRFSQGEVCVTALPAGATARIQVYDASSLRNVYRDAPEHGYSLIVIPAFSQTHLSFAIDAPGYPSFAVRPLVGWVAGIDLTELGKRTPKVYSGQDAEPREDGAVVLHVTLPASRAATVGIVNIFEPGEGETFTFPKDGFSAGEVLVDGERRNFAEFVQQRGLDTKLPLVADYYGVRVNTSFQSVDAAAGTVNFYAPVFTGTPYKLARPVGSYFERFAAEVQAGGAHEGEAAFSCNCILNYLYSGLEGRQTGRFVGPVTFGEIAYQLVNQTLVYLDIVQLEG